MLDDLALYFSTRKPARPAEDPPPTVGGPAEPERDPVERTS
jgi:hypothetical protein